VSTPLRSCSPLRPNVIKISRAREVVLKVNAPYHREFSRDLDVLSVDLDAQRANAFYCEADCISCSGISASSGWRFQYS
jgi:hypothetical protein